LPGVGRFNAITTKGGVMKEEKKEELTFKEDSPEGYPLATPRKKENLISELAEIRGKITGIEIGIAEIKVGQTYLAWMVGISFMLSIASITISVGIIWKLFELIKLIGP